MSFMTQAPHDLCIAFFTRLPRARVAALSQGHAAAMTLLLESQVMFSSMCSLDE
jgi:hypothetical protein